MCIPDCVQNTTLRMVPTNNLWDATDGQHLYLVLDTTTAMCIRDCVQNTTS